MLKGYDSWKLRSDLDDVAALQHECPPGLCSLCGEPFDEDETPLGFWSSEGWSATLCDACVGELRTRIAP